MLTEVSLHISSLSVCKGYGVKMEDIVASLKTLLGDLKELLHKEFGTDWATKSHNKSEIETVLHKGNISDSLNQLFC